MNLNSYNTYYILGMIFVIIGIISINIFNDWKFGFFSVLLGFMDIILGELNLIQTKLEEVQK